MPSDFLKIALSFMADAGLVIDNPITDGKLHRCGVTDKPRGKDGAYLIHLDKPASVWCCNWVSGYRGSTSEKNNTELSAKERKLLQERIRIAKEAAAKEEAARYKQGAEVANRLWQHANPASEHPYLERKQVKSHGLRIGRDNTLFVPVLNERGQITSLQKIRAEKPANGSQKQFLRKGKTKGGFYCIPATDGGKNSPLLIAEGYATAASAHEATGYEVLIAFSADNLLAVSKMARERFPTRTICLCADFDILKSDANKERFPDAGGVGVAKAKEAAFTIAGCLAIPPAKNGGKLDFNDLHCRDDLGAVKTQIEAAIVKGPITTCPMPHGFYISKGKNPGLYFHAVKPDGSNDDIRLGPPLEILAATRDSDGNDWGLMLSWHDLDNREHIWAMPMSLLYSQRGEWFSTLAYGGWSGNPSCRKRIGEFLASARPLRRIQCVPNTGWHNDCYVLPDKVCGNGNDIVLQSASHSGLYKCAGDMDGWRELANLCVGNSRLTFAISCAFAGPLLKLAGIDGGGFSFEGQSSSGKSTSLLAAASVWGGQEHMRGWRTTDNGLEGAALLHNDGLLILDELSQVRARVLDEAIYMLANGSGKSRAAKDGSLRKSYRWRALVLSSGELGIADKLLEDGKQARAGQEVRLVGIPVEKTDICNLHGLIDSSQLIQRVKEISSQHYGHAGRAFLEKLCDPDVLADMRTNLRQNVETCVRNLYQNADGQVLRVAMRFILVGYAGDKAEEWGILPKGFNAMSAALDCLKAWLDRRGGTGPAEDKAILEQVQGIIERDGQGRFQPVEDSETQVWLNRLGFVDRKKSPVEYIILPEQFKREFAKGYAVRKVVQVLRDTGWIEIGRNGRSKTRRTLPNMGQQEVYVLCMPENKEDQN